MLLAGEVIQIYQLLNTVYGVILRIQGVILKIKIEPTRQVTC